MRETESAVVMKAGRDDTVTRTRMSAREYTRMAGLFCLPEMYRCIFTADIFVATNVGRVNA